MSNPTFSVKVLLVVICALVSIIVATGTAILTYTTGVSMAEAILSAGGAFAVSMGLSLTTLAALGLL
ncbi:hypothetical protein E4N62_19680 [Streptomyces sp. MNU76]|uniref:hypothetical protein n=1 Tax=Streptomyces sp. MNU76 TaxID=2560026 RepID=UPI001E5AE4F6|nr:hypothetical protein [Streptomyces sp. MNU76]MCC9707301.1 hypothetical protein [Streptomyces sp. MNU76]